VEILRKQKVLLDGYSSEESSVMSGVPQGTVLGPLMFLLYVNDIADKISPQTRIKLFADDCLLYRTIDTKQDHKQLQQDLNTLVDWSRLVYGMGPILLKCTRDVVVLMK
jgi:hypothetical protein